MNSQKEFVYNYADIGFNQSSNVKNWRWNCCSLQQTNKNTIYCIFAKRFHTIY